MNTTLTPQQLRLVALLGMFVVLTGGAVLVLSRHKPSSTPTVPLAVHHAKTSATPTVSPHVRPAATKPHAPATSPTVVKPAPIARHGLPLAVAQSLRTNRVVVVSLVTPGADVDRMARDEAAAAARSTHAGYVSLNVLSQADGIPLLKKLGLVQAPAVLVVMRPARIFAQLEGFADRQTVVQAVSDARR